MKNTLLPLVLATISCTRQESFSKTAQLPKPPDPLALLKGASNVFCALTGGQSYSQAEQQGARTFMGDLWNSASFLETTAEVFKKAAGKVVEDAIKEQIAQFLLSEAGAELIRKAMAQGLSHELARRTLENTLVAKFLQQQLIQVVGWRIPPSFATSLANGAVSYIAGRVACDSVRATVAAVEAGAAWHAVGRDAERQKYWEEQTCKRLRERAAAGSSPGMLPDWCPES